MKKLIYRAVAGFLTTLLIGSQNFVLAEELINNLKTASEKSSISKFEPEILEEVTSKRSEFTKHFRMSDGTMSAVVYSDQIHYKKGDKFEEIDNSLIESENEYKNAENPLEVRISKRSDDKKLVTLENEGHEISWNYIKKNRKIIKKVKVSDEKQATDEAKLDAEVSEDSTSEKTEIKPKFKEVAEISNAKPEAAQVESFKSETKNFKNKKEKMTDVSKNYSKAKYKNTDPEVDLDYTLSGLGLKENIILNKKLDLSEGHSFDFEFKANGLNIEKTKTGDLNFVDKNGKVIFVMPKGLMWDSSENFSDKIEYKFEKIEGKNGYIISVIPDAKWLDSAVYPVTIDPSLITNPTLENSTHESAVTDPANLDLNSEFHNHLPAGTSTRNYMSFLRYTGLPIFTHGEMVTGANFSMKLPTSYTEMDVVTGTLPLYTAIRPVMGPWKASEITFRNQPKIDTNVAEYAKIDTINKEYNFDITRLAKEWYMFDNPNENFGFMLNNVDVSQYGLARFVSKHSTQYPNGGPKLTISYRNFIGEEPYWSYTPAGAGKINNYAGTLSLSENILSYSGSRNPVSIVNTYNNPHYKEHANTYVQEERFENGYTHSSSTGLGWSLDFNQLLYEIQPTGDSANMYENGFRYLFIDDDGTWHYFKVEGNEFIDEDGLRLRIKLVSGNANQLEMVDKFDNKLTFEKKATSSPENRCFCLISSSDSGENTTTYQYASKPNTGGCPDSLKVTMITDAAGRHTHIIYNENGEEKGTVAEIIHADGKKVKFKYDGQKLVEVEYPDGLKSGYKYDEHGRLAQVWTNVGTGSSVEYKYASNSPMSQNFHRICSATEFGSENIDQNKKGNSTHFDYEMNQTKITHKVNNLDVPYRESTEVWQFDDQGRTTCVMDEAGNMVSNVYETATDGRKHKVKRSNDTGKYTNNLLKNSAANSDLSNWTVKDWLGTVDPLKVTASTDTSNLGQKSFKISQTSNLSWPIAEQKVKIKPVKHDRKFTLSADIKIPQELQGGEGASLHLAAFSGNSQQSKDQYSEWLKSTDPGANDGWRRISVTANIPAGTDSISCYFGVKNSSGTAYFDCLQLEESEFASDYNMVENSSFDQGFEHWDKMNFEENIDIIENGKLKIVGRPNLKKAAIQSIPVGKIDPTISLRATAQGVAPPQLSEKVPGNTYVRYYIAVKLTYADGSEHWIDTDVDSYFNSNVSGPQMLYRSIRTQDYNPGVELTKIQIMPAFYAGVNAVYFSEIQVCVDDHDEAYQRDVEGNITQLTNNLNKHTNTQMTPNNEPEIITQPSGEVTTNTYDSNWPHRLLTSTSPIIGNDVKSSTTYDSYGNITNSKFQKSDGTGKLIEGSTAYSNAGNYPVSSIDPHGKTTNFEYYNETRGLLKKTTNPKGIETEFKYDSGDRILSKTMGNSEVNYGYQNGILNSLSHTISGNANVTYNFVRDIFGKITQSKVGKYMLSTNKYDDGNGLLKEVKYANNQVVKFTYDKLGRMVKMQHLSGKDRREFKYIYDDQNRIVETFDSENNLSTKFEYDMFGRIVHTRRSDGVSSDLSFDNVRNLVNKTFIKFFGKEQKIEHTYGISNMLEKTEIKLNGSTNPIKSSYAYDSLGRVDFATSETAGNGVKHKVSYVDVGQNNTTNLVNSFEAMKKDGTNLNKKWNYKYDNLGNITDVEDSNNNLIVHYEYDNLNQLARENNVNTGKTVIYTYDFGGNILKKEIYAYTTSPTPTNPEKTVEYSYCDQDWKDKLTHFDGQKIIYDAIGNPLQYRDGWSFEWKNGRQLDKMEKIGYNIGCKYDEGGVRTEKVVNGVKTEFVTSGIQILAQKTDDKIITWQIDGNGANIGFTYNGTQYFYLKNAQGDIVGITDENGTLIVEYVYDSWGKLVSINDTSGCNIGEINPLRYRGYYFDSEMGLYYLNARYYDPEIGRFLNADDNLEGGLNLFAYCYNNPVNFVDYDGEFAVIATLGALTAADLIIGGGILVSGAAAIWSASPAGKKTINKLAQATDKAVRSAVQTVKTALTPAAPGKPDNNKDKNKKKDSAKSKNKAKNTNLKKISSNTEANKTAKKFDYKGAEDLKKDFVGKSNISKYNMMKDTKTGEIILQSISDSAKQITTGLFV